jgi:hypothetical protein
MMRIFSLVSFVFLCIAVATSSVSRGQDSLGDQYPSDTRCLFVIPNVPEFLSAASRSETVKSLLQLPGPALANLLVHRAQQDARFKAAIEIDDGDTAVLQRLSELFDGVLEVALVEHDGSLALLAKADVNSEDPIVNAIEAFLTDQVNLEFFEFETIELISGRSALVHRPSGNCFEYFENKLWFYSTPTVAKGIEKWKSEKSVKRLSDSRKFQLLKQRCRFSDLVQNNGAWIYVDANALLADVIKKSSNPNQSRTFSHEAALNELLAVGAVLQWETEQKQFQGAVDFELKFHIAQGMPRTGINNILRLDTLVKPVADDIPANVDVYFSANIDLNSLVKGIQSLDAILADYFTTEKLATRSLLNTLPLLGAICYEVDEEQTTGIQGLLEHFGNLHDTTHGLAFMSITRLSGFTDNSGEMLDLLVAKEIAKGTLVKTNLLGIDCATWSESFELAQQRDKERIKKLFPDIVLPKMGRQIFFAQNDQIGLASDEAFFEQTVTGTVEEFLVNSTAFKNSWDYVSRDASPGAFIYLSPGTLFRPVTHLTRTEGKILYHESRLKATENSGANTDSWENTYHRSAIQANRSWHHSTLRQGLGPSGISFVETPNGFDIRIVHFRKQNE